MKSHSLLAIGSLVLATAATAGAQTSTSQISTRTNRLGERAPLSPATDGSAKISDIPRYYLDTLDVLQRNATDANRTGLPTGGNAFGLSKNNYVGKAYSIKNTRAIEIQSYLLRTLAYEGGTAEVAGLGGVDGDGPASQTLIVTMPDFMEPFIDQIVETCDVEGFKFYDATGRDNGKGMLGATQYIGKHRTASELRSILAGTEIGNIAGFMFPPFADDSTNSIYIVENPTDIADDIAALEMFDKPPLQMELSVKIFEVSSGDDVDLGLDWDAWKRGLSGSMALAVGPYTIGEGGGATPGAVFTSGLGLDAAVLAEFANYLTTKNKAEVITDTTLTMVNSEDVGGLGGARGASTQTPATISTGTAFSYIVPAGVASDGGRLVVPQINGAALSSAPNPQGTLLSANDGVSLNILPFIGTESITLNVSYTVDSIAGFSPDGFPLASSRTSSSVVNLVDGQSIVLGGLTKTTEISSKRGIPFLKDIPVLGYVFGNEVKQKRESAIVIFLKPTIKGGGSDESGRAPATTIALP